jgi:hypothetical protein
MIRRVGEDGEVTRGGREIDPEEAAIARRIFDAYAAGVSPRTIAAQLNGEGSRARGPVFGMRQRSTATVNGGTVS